MQRDTFIILIILCNKGASVDYNNTTNFIPGDNVVADIPQTPCCSVKVPLSCLSIVQLLCVNLFSS